MTVVFSNGLVLLSSVLSGFVIPALLGIVNYGYYKTFTLYIGYTALFHFGFVDGILLMYAGKDYSEINKREFRVYTRFISIMQLVVGGIIFLFAIYNFSGINRYIILMVGVETIVNNLTAYYQYISQATMRFKELSIRRILQAFIKIIVIIILIVMCKAGILKEISAQLYIFSIVMVDFCLLVWYTFTYKEITWGEKEKKSLYYEKILQYFKKGITLTISFQIGNLIFSIDSQFVLMLFDTKVYGLYSFAYSIISMITVLIGSISFVLFPTLKKSGENTVIKYFSDSIALISMLVFGAHMGYYILCWFVKGILPEYYASMQYLRLLFPGLSLSCCISIIIFTYYKVLNKNNVYFSLGCIVLCIAVILNLGAYSLFHSALAISGASLLTLLFWFGLSEFYFVKNYNIKWKKNILYIISMSFCFWGVAYASDDSVFGCIVYVILYLVLTIMFNKEVLKKYIRKIG